MIKVKRNQLIYLCFIAILAMWLGALYYCAYSFSELNKQTYFEEKIRYLHREIDQYLVKATAVAKILSHDENIQLLFEGNPNGIAKKVDTVLNTVKKISGASIVYVMDIKGNVVGSSLYNSGKTLLGNNYSFRPYFTQALLGNDVVYPALGVTTFKRGMYVSTPIYFTQQGTLAGVVVLKMGLTEIDNMLLDQEMLSALVSPDGVIFSSSKPAWVFHTFSPLHKDVQSRLLRTHQFADIRISPLKIKYAEHITIIEGIRYKMLELPLSIKGWKISTFYKDSMNLMLSKEQKRTLSLNLIFSLTLMFISVLVFMKKVKLDELILRLQEEVNKLKKLISKKDFELEDVNKRLEKELVERNGMEEKFHLKMKELKRFNKLAIGRELRMMELKREINNLRMEDGYNKKYRDIIEEE